MTLQTKPKTYLITGAAGFIGSQLSGALSKQGHKLVFVDLVDPADQANQKSHFEERTEHHPLPHGEFVDRRELWNWLKTSKPQLDAIFHLGAITDTRETDTQKLDSQNLQYSKQIWNYACEHRIPLTYASSAATYGDGAAGYDDNEALIPQLKPLNLYGESKQNFDLWVLEQERAGHTPPCWSGFKFFNVYGSGERHKGFMSSVVLHAFDQIQEKGQVTLFKSHRAGIADGHQKRDFISVEDVIEVLQYAIEHPISRGIYNLGTGKARTFLDLTQAVFAALGKKPEIHFIETPLTIRDKYQYFTEAKMDKLKKQGYLKPFRSLEEGVRSYVKKLLQT